MCECTVFYVCLPYRKRWPRVCVYWVNIHSHTFPFYDACTLLCANFHTILWANMQVFPLSFYIIQFDAGSRCFEYRLKSISSYVSPFTTCVSHLLALSYVCERIYVYYRLELSTSSTDIMSVSVLALAIAGPVAYWCLLWDTSYCVSYPTATYRNPNEFAAICPAFEQSVRSAVDHGGQIVNPYGFIIFFFFYKLLFFKLIFL